LLLLLFIFFHTYQRSFNHLTIIPQEFGMLQIHDLFLGGNECLFMNKEEKEKEEKEGVR
jgi:hypothetical protein